MVEHPLRSSRGADRIGRYLLLRDLDGRQMAVSPTALLVAVQLDGGGTQVLLAGGRVLQFAEDLEAVVGWFC